MTQVLESADKSSPKSIRQSVPPTPQLRIDVLGISLVMHLLALALPLALLQIYDRILPSQSYGTAGILILGVGIAIVLGMILHYGRLSLFATAGARYEAQTMAAMYQRLMGADIKEIESIGSAAYSDAMRAIAQVRDFWSGQAGASLYEVPFVFVYIALIAYIGGWLAIIPLSLFILAIVIAFRLNPAIQRVSQQLEQESETRRDFSWLLFAGLPYLKAIGAEGGIAEKWSRINARYMQHTSMLEARMGWVRENAASFGQLSTVLIVCFGAVAVVSGEMTTGALAACTMLAGRSIGPAMGSLGYWSQWSRVREAQQKVDKILSLPDNPAMSPAADNSAIRVESGRLQIEAEELLSSAVDISPGQLVHVDSMNTADASRLMTAISGMSYDPEIRIKVDGHTLNDYTQDQYRNDVMLVTRRLALVPGSILNNLTLFDPRYNNDVAALSEALGLQSHLNYLRHGILTEVGPASAEQLDEGIYQRIAIIRALLRKPRILLLDHAASGIDIDGVNRLVEYLKTQRGQTTILIATYKQELIDICDTSIQLQASGGAA